MATSPRPRQLGSLPPFLPLALGPRPPAGPPSPRCQCLVPRKLSAGVRTEHARRRRGRAWGPEAAPTPPAPATCGVAGPRRAMLSARGPGRATWVLAGSLLAAALTLPAESRKLDQLPAGRVPLQHPLGPRPLRDPPTAPGVGPERTAQVRRTGYQSRV